jgi:phage protein D/phage baseplate assembly protein gpV
MMLTSTAALAVKVDGSPVPADLTAKILSVRVASRLGLPAQAELAYAVLRGSGTELSTFQLGAALTVRIEGDSTLLFDGQITASALVHGPDGAAQCRVRGYDKLHLLRKRQQLRFFSDVTAPELAEKLCGPDGIGVSADETGPTFQRVIQYCQTDFGLLSEICSRAGLYPVLNGDTLRLCTLRGTGEDVKLELGRTLVEATLEANLDRAAQGFTAFGWDRRSAKLFREQVGNPRGGAAIQTGPHLSSLGVDGELMLVDQQGATAAEVAARAQAELDIRAASTVTLRGVAVGDADLRAGTSVEVSGVAAEFVGSYVLTEAVHTIDATGFHTTLGTEPPAAPAAQPSASITLGTVTDVDDPEGLGRVQISLPAYGDPDVGWLGVLCAGAGKKRGIVALPDVGDTVLVALSHGPVGGVVLGGLYGGDKPPDPGVDGGQIKRWSLHTADGQRLVFDDSAHTITFADRAGSTLSMAPGKVALHAETDLDISAPGKTITIKANAVEFVREQ